MKTHGLQKDEFNKKRNIVGETSMCIDSNCTGWLVDSILGIYWIRCKDPCHNGGAKKNIENDRPEQISDGSSTTSNDNGINPRL